MSETKKKQKIKKFSDLIRANAQAEHPIPDLENVLRFVERDADYHQSVRAVFPEAEKLAVPEWWKPDMDILFCGYVGMAGTIAIGEHCREALEQRFCRQFLDEAADFSEKLYYPEPDFLREIGAQGVYPLGEGGLYRALFDLWLDSNYGFRIVYGDVTTNQYTVEYCELYDQDPWELLSSGSLLILAENGNAVARRLEAQGMRCKCIGYTAKDKDKIICHTEGEGLLNRPQPDAFLNILKMEAGL